MLEVVEGVQSVATFFAAVFRVNVANQMSAPTSASIQEVRDLTTDTAVTSTIMPSGSASIESTTYVKFPKAQSFTAGHLYSVRFSFANADNTLAGEVKLKCEF